MEVSLMMFCWEMVMRVGDEVEYEELGMVIGYCS